MVNGNDWEERKMGRATEQEQDQERAVRGVAKLCSLASSFFFFFLLLFFLLPFYGHEFRNTHTAGL